MFFMLGLMHLKTFCVPYNPESKSFDDEELSSFVAERVIIGIDSHFLSIDNLPAWAVMVRYRELSSSSKICVAFRYLAILFFYSSRDSYFSFVQNG